MFAAGWVGVAAALSGVFAALAGFTGVAGLPRGSVLGAAGGAMDFQKGCFSAGLAGLLSLEALDWERTSRSNKLGVLASGAFVTEGGLGDAEFVLEPFGAMALVAGAFVAGALVTGVLVAGALAVGALEAALAAGFGAAFSGAVNLAGAALGAACCLPRCQKGFDSFCLAASLGAIALAGGLGVMGVGAIALTGAGLGVAFFRGAVTAFADSFKVVPLGSASFP